MHLERFGSLDEIVRAKSELAQALPPGGLLVVNADSPGALRIAKALDRPPRAALRRDVGRGARHPRSRACSSRSRARRSCCGPATGVYHCFTPLLGRPIILNIAGAFTLASALGVDPEVIVAALRTLKPVSNRLEVVEERGISWIRDAYNSNQFGFRAALEVAAALPVDRRFLATPGVIELGAAAVRRQPGAVARGGGRLRPHHRGLGHQSRGVCRRTSGCRPRGSAGRGAEPDRGVSLAERDAQAPATSSSSRTICRISTSGRKALFWKDRRSRARDGVDERAPARRRRGVRTVAVLFGGRSLEHDVSIVSGLQVAHALDPGQLCRRAGLHRSATAAGGPATTCGTPNRTRAAVPIDRG